MRVSACTGCKVSNYTHNHDKLATGDAFDGNCQMVDGNSLACKAIWENVIS